ncbi:MAG: AAA family ATPase [Pseudomonadota bacterium]|nr:AAA family ATPase [Pseudomonadota bacterium]
MLLPDTAPPIPSEVRGRFELRGRLGAGGNGVVYRALDLSSAEHVALKMLHHGGPEQQRALKREFRSLADVRHPNLVLLYELFAEATPTFLTMELLDGVDLLTFLRPGLVGPPDAAGMARLHDAFAQLLAGVAALHDAARVHRDLKPGNVMGCRDGRIVLLDAGLVTRSEPSTLSFGAGAGTPRYMAPEQALGADARPSADVFAVACLFAEALTGLPCNDARARAAAGGHPLLTEEWSQLGASPALAEGMAAALDPNPQARPALEVLRAALPAPRRGAPPLAAAPSEPPFVGRAAELAFLDDTVGRWNRRDPTLFLLEGASGVGKTRLLRTWLTRLDRQEYVVLETRCDRTETVTFQALDRALDRIGSDLLSGAFEAPPLPREAVRALASVFPVLGYALDARAIDLSPDGASPRTRAFAALRELLRAYARRRPTLLVIDDAQWMDPDSETLVQELLRPPEPPAVTVVLVARAAVPGHPGAPTLGFRELSRLAIGPLDPLEAAQLASRLGASRAEEVAQASGGLPFFVAALARSGGLDGWIDGALAVAGPSGRALLRAAAVAGGPLPRLGVQRALPAASRALDSLFSARVLREAPCEVGPGVILSHDRMAEAVLAALSTEERRQLHELVARVLSSADDPRAELRAGHLLAAGEQSEAVGVALEGAEAASRALAYEQALRLYTLVLELEPEGRGREARQPRADLLASLGRSTAAAAAYQEVLRDARTPTARTAAAVALIEQSYRAGLVHEGRAHLVALLGELGFAAPRSRFGYAFGVLAQRARLVLRGLAWRVAPAGDARSALGLDALWAATTVTAFYDGVESEYWSLAHLRAALEGGPAGSVARALAWEATMRARFSGTFLAHRVDELLAAAHRLAEGGSAYDRGLVGINEVFVRFLEGDAKRCLAAAETALRSLASHPAPTSWERVHVEVFAVGMRWYSGDVRRIRELAHALDLGSLSPDRAGLLDTGHFWSATRVALLEGRTADATRILDACEARWAHIGQPLGAWSSVLARAEIHLAAGDAAAAWDTLSNGAPRVRSSGALLLPWARGTWLFQRAGVAIALIQRDHARRRHLLREVHAAATWLRRARWSVGPCAAGLLEAGLTLTLQGGVPALPLLTDAAERAREVDAGLLAWTAEYISAAVRGAPPPPCLDAEITSARLAHAVLPILLPKSDQLRIPET